MGFLDDIERGFRVLGTTFLPVIGAVTGTSPLLTPLAAQLDPGDIGAQTIPSDRDLLQTPEEAWAELANRPDDLGAIARGFTAETWLRDSLNNFSREFIAVRQAVERSSIPLAQEIAREFGLLPLPAEPELFIQEGTQAAQQIETVVDFYAGVDQDLPDPAVEVPEENKGGGLVLTAGVLAAFAFS